jgi:pyruvate decarboxylase
MLIGSSNELNAAYAADGFARVAQSVNSRSIGVVTTTLVPHVKYE